MLLLQYIDMLTICLFDNIQKDVVPRVVTKIENFFVTCPKPYRLSALYLIDSICKSKADLRKDYIEAFSARLPHLMSIFLKDAVEKDQVRISRLSQLESIFPSI